MDWQTSDEFIKTYLQGEEKLLWSGQPTKGIKLRPHDIFFIPFGLFMAVFAIVWLSIGLHVTFTEEAEETGLVIWIFMLLFGLPFLIIGLYFLLGRFLVEAKQRKKTFYGVTSERIIVVSGLFSQKVTSLNLRTLTDITMHQKRDGSGTIIFGPSNFMSNIFIAFQQFGMGQISPQFEFIPNVIEVHNIIRDTQKPHE